jgi:hypothetical protein
MIFRHKSGSFSQSFISRFTHIARYYRKTGNEILSKNPPDFFGEQNLNNL